MRFIRKTAIFSLILAIITITIFLPGEAATTCALQKSLPVLRTKAAPPVSLPFSGAGKVVVIVVDRLTLADLDPASRFRSGSLPNFHRLIRQGALGLMNCNTAGAAGDPENTYATIGAGAHVMAPGTGALGAALHQGGLKTAVLGNADTFLGQRRQAASLAMDENSRVDYGNAGAGLLTKDARFPGGLKTDYAALFRELVRLPGDAALIVIETGDLARLEEFKADFPESVLAAGRTQALASLDVFLGKITRFLDLKKDLLFVVAPTCSHPPPDRQSYLSPVLAAGAGLPPGFLLSPGTRRPGIIQNTDLAPTILHYFRLPVPGEMSGRPVQALAAASGQFPALAAMQKQLALTYTARPWVQKGYVIYQLILLAAGLGCIFFRGRAQTQTFSVILRPFLLSVPAVPLAYLLLPLFPQPSWPVLALELVLLTAGLTFLAFAAGRRSALGAVLCLGVPAAGLLLADTLLGSPLQKTSLLGYDPIVGARFYGIGNEFMGVLTGSLAVGGTAALAFLPRLGRAGRPALGLLFLLGLFVLGNPRLGANLGGFIAASTAFLITFLLLYEIRFSAKIVFGLAGAVVFLVASLFWIDLQRAPEVQSHFGRSATLVVSGGWPEAAEIVKRKSEMNLKLFKSTAWSRVFLASLAGLTLLFYRPAGVLAGLRNAYPALYKGFLGAVAGSVAALLFNDSGIVAAATTLIFVLSPLLYLVLTAQSK